MIKIKQKHVPAVAIVCMLIITHMLALNVVQTYPQQYQAFGEDVNNPVNPLIYIGFILLFTGGMLLLFKYGKGNILQYLITGVVGLTLFYVFYPVLWVAGSSIYEILQFDWAFPTAVFLSLTLTYFMYKKPEWYVVDGIALIMGAGIAGIFGMTFGILPVFILLIALAVYDFISVYKTEHMLDLASGVMDFKLPVMMVVPEKKNYSYSKDENVVKKRKKGKEREAMFMGLGDIIIPGILPVSASLYLTPKMVAGHYGPYLVAVGSVLGAVCGMLVLQHFVLKGKAHAGLPLLNSGVISGYMITYFLVYQNLTFGIVAPWLI